MGANFVNIDHDAPMLLPSDLWQWVPEDHMVHFIMVAVSLLDVSAAKVNARGTGSIPPGMMLGLLIYSYASGIFSSRKIERLTHENVAARLLCGTPTRIMTASASSGGRTRRCCKAAFTRCWSARRATRCCVWEKWCAKILANANKHSAVSHGRAMEQMKLLEEQIGELLAKSRGRGQRAAAGRAEPA